MATYAIGDLQGCFEEFTALLEVIDFDEQQDRLWLVGDLVNRGPDSLEVMHKVMRLGDAVTAVLGNHDLHLLALASVPGQQPRRKDTLDKILAADERPDIIAWLRKQPLFHYDPDLGFAMVHAGVPAAWSVREALAHAQEVQATLADDRKAGEFLASMYGDKPDVWRDNLRGGERLRMITNYLTRMRYCDVEGRLDLKEKGAPDSAEFGVYPWFTAANRHAAQTSLVFGHWSTLELNASECAEYNVYPLDTGCVWGGALTALRLEDRQYFSVPARSQIPPS